MVMCTWSLRLSVAVVVCALAISCGRRQGNPEESIAGVPAPEAAAREDGDGGAPATASTAAEVATSMSRYDVEARSSSRMGVAQDTPSDSVLKARYSLAVERVARDGLFTLTITPEVESVSDGLEWVEGTLPGEWRRQYRQNGDFAGGRDSDEVSVFNWATQGLFSVPHLVLSLPAIRLEAGETWRRTDRQPNGRLETEIELVGVTQDRISLRGSTVFMPFSDDGSFSWRETIEGSYERGSRMAIEVEIRHERRLSSVAKRNGAPIAISSIVTVEKSVKRVSG